MYRPRVEYPHLRHGGVLSAAALSPGMMDARFSNFAPSVGSNFIGGYSGFPPQAQLLRGPVSLQPTQTAMVVKQPPIQSMQFQMRPLQQQSQPIFLQHPSEFQIHPPLMQLPKHGHFIPPLPFSLPADIPPPPPAGAPPSPPPPPPVAQETISSESVRAFPLKIPSDPEMVTNIDVLATFVVQNGIQFERMARAKRAGDPKYAFLFSGDPGTEAAIGHVYYEWKKQSLESEILQKAENTAPENLACSQVFTCRQDSMPGPSVGTVIIPGSPTAYDVEMEDVSALSDPETDKCKDVPNNFSGPHKVSERFSNELDIRQVPHSESPVAIKFIVEQDAFFGEGLGRDLTSTCLDIQGSKVKQGLVMEDLSPVCSPSSNKSEIKVLSIGDSRMDREIVGSCRASSWTFQQGVEQGHMSSDVPHTKRDDPAQSNEKEQEVKDPSKFRDDGLSRINDAYPDGEDTSFANSGEEKDFENDNRKGIQLDEKVATNEELSSKNDWEGYEKGYSEGHQALEKRSYTSGSQSPRTSRLRGRVINSSPAHSGSRSESPKWKGCEKTQIKDSKGSVGDHGSPAEDRRDDCMDFDHAKGELYTCTLLVHETSPMMQQASSGDLSHQPKYLSLPENSFSQHGQPLSIPSMMTGYSSRPQLCKDTLPWSSAFMSRYQPAAHGVYPTSLLSDSVVLESPAAAQEPIVSRINKTFPFSVNTAASQTGNSTSMLAQRGFNAMSVLTFKPDLRQRFTVETSKHFTFLHGVRSDTQSGMLTGVTTEPTLAIQNSSMGMPLAKLDLAMQSSGPAQSSVSTYLLTSMPLVPPLSTDTSLGKPYDPLADSIEPDTSFVYTQSMARSSDIPVDILKVNQSGDLNHGGVMAKIVGTISANTSVYATENIEARHLKLSQKMPHNPGTMTAKDENLIRGIENLNPQDSKHDRSHSQPVQTVTGEMKMRKEQRTKMRNEKGKSKVKKSEGRGLKLLRAAIAEYAKEVLKPTWREGHMRKEEFKTIVKKAVDKVIGTLQSHQIPKSQEKVDLYMASSKAKISKLIQSYVAKHSKA